MMFVSFLLLLSGGAVSSFQAPLSIQRRATTTTTLLFQHQQQQQSASSNSALEITLQSIDGLANGSDIRGKFVDHPREGNLQDVTKAIIDAGCVATAAAALTPLAAHCLGFAFGQVLLKEQQQQSSESDTKIKICIGCDPRPHGVRLADAFARGCIASDVDGNRINVAYTGIATTPSMMDFCRTNLCDAAVILTASHLPVDRNGMKFFTSMKGGFTKRDIQELIAVAKDHVVHSWQNTLPPTSEEEEGVVSSATKVDYMPYYAASLTKAIQQETSSSSDEPPLTGLTIVLNSGNGSGGFFHDVLHNLGADVSASIGIDHDSTFPLGVPNPESKLMVAETTRVCQETNADLGIMLDTDADRCGFIVPSSSSSSAHDDGYYEPLNRNRLIALLGVIFKKTSPGCTFVTDSVTSEGLEDFLQNKLGLVHVRYLKGYANVIRRAKEITDSDDGAAVAEVAIETSGHCAMRENDYLDDGTYTAVKVIGLLAKVKQEGGNLLDLISDLKEMPETQEFRMLVQDETMATTAAIFDLLTKAVEECCQSNSDWSVDTDNLEGLRVRTGTDGGFFMIRKSLHDPLVSMQVEGGSADQILAQVIHPLLQLMESEDLIQSSLDLSALKDYS